MKELNKQLFFKINYEENFEDLVEQIFKYYSLSYQSVQNVMQKKDLKDFAFDVSEQMLYRVYDNIDGKPSTYTKRTIVQEEEKK